MHLLGGEGDDGRADARWPAFATPAVQRPDRRVREDHGTSADTYGLPVAQRRHAVHVDGHPLAWCVLPDLVVLRDPKDDLVILR